ncbi:MAG: deoxyribodipyrimidine photo-lyase [Syntrophorhabdaceae bacterium]|nr:deoxyribodipyrimidine photo-lyase [Syntrophorhabdaceae bacterium]
MIPERISVKLERVKVLREGKEVPGAVAYWMSRDQRVNDNWALAFAQELAMKRRSPLVVMFSLAPQFLYASVRHYDFMLIGLKETEQKLKTLKIPFFAITGEPGDSVPHFVATRRIACLVTDFDPLRIKRKWKEYVAAGIEIPFYEVDAHNIVPCRTASPRQDFGAYTIRKKIERLLPGFLEKFPKPAVHPWQHGITWTRTDWERLSGMLRANRTVKAVDWIVPGEKAAKRALMHFIKKKIALYNAGRNDPSKDCQSSLSPYLHFGHLSAQRVALEVIKNVPDVPARSSFLEELIVRRELSDNFCLYNPRYDSFEGFPEWAKTTLNAHRKDKRAYRYGMEEFEEGRTHDDLWNAAQFEMVIKGKMHGYMRMYWAKKILEWSGSPEEAMETAIYLNNRYELDGRDPNGYAGIAWSIGGVHDRAWGERNIFGKIRYMSYNGCKSKFDIRRYIQNVSALKKRD